MGFLANGTIGHGPGNKTLQDGFNRFYLLNRNGFTFFNIHTTSYKMRSAVFIVNLCAEFFVFTIVIRMGGPLQQAYGIRIPGMKFTIFTVMVNAFIMQSP